MLKFLMLRANLVVGGGLIFCFLLIALLAPVIAPPLNPRQPYMIARDGFSATPREPGTLWQSRPPPLPVWWRTFMSTDHWVHLLGTTGGQWDLFYGLVWGTRTAFKVGLIIEGVALALGLLVGSVAGYSGGWIDEILMRITDSFLAFPALFAALTLSTILTPLLGKGIWPATVTLIVFGWMGYARLVRAEILALRQRDFVVAAKVSGASARRILLRHLAPNAMIPPLIVASFNIGSDVLAFAALSFLGVGVEIGYADWGQLVSMSRNWIPLLSTYWWLVVWPSLALTLFVLGWNLLGDGLRDQFDPHIRNRQ